MTLALLFYTIFMLFLSAYLVKGLLLLKSRPAQIHAEVDLGRYLFKGIFDILSFRRLLAVNGALWIGEWLFHVSLLLVAIRHLRYFLDPIPHWIWVMQPLGIMGGYVLPVALAYIIIVKILIERKKYVSTGNFFLLALIFAMSATGLLMKTTYRPDVVAVKDFILGAVILRPVMPPESVSFLIHFALFLIFFAYLPSHFFAAPLTIIHSRLRQEKLPEVMHE